VNLLWIIPGSLTFSLLAGEVLVAVKMVVAAVLVGM